MSIISAVSGHHQRRVNLATARHSDSSMNRGIPTPDFKPRHASHTEEHNNCMVNRTTLDKLECGQMPNLMVELPNTRGALCSTPQRPKFTILWEHVEDISLLNKFFPIVDMCLSCEDIARQSCAMVPRWRFLATLLRPAFPASRVQQVSDLHLKFALRPHHVWKYGRHQIYGR